MQTLPNGIKQFDPSDNANTANFNAALKSVDDALGMKAPKASPQFTGTPTAPTATAGTNTTQIATTEFVQGAVGAKLDKAGDTMSGTLNVPRVNTTNTTGRQVNAYQWADLSSNVSGHALFANNAYTDGSGNWRYANTHASLGSRGIRLSSGGGMEYFDTGAVATIAGATFTPTWIKMSLANDYVRLPGYATTAGLANAYTATLSPAPTAYTEGMAIAVKINVANTSASTIDVNSLGAKAIKKVNGNDVTAGNLKAGGIYTLRYNGTAFILQGEGGGGNAQPADVRAGSTFTNDDGEQVGTGTILNNFFGDGSDGDFNPATLLINGTTAPNGGTVVNLWDGNTSTLFTTNTLDASTSSPVIVIDLGVNYAAYGHIASISVNGSVISSGTSRLLGLQMSDDGATWIDLGTMTVVATAANRTLSLATAATRRYWRFVLQSGGSTCTFQCNGLSINTSVPTTPWSIIFPIAAQSGIAIKQFSSFTLPTGYQVTTSNPCRGLAIYSQQDINISGTIDMSQKGGIAPNGESVPTLITKDATKTGKTSSLLHFNGTNDSKTITDENGRTWTTFGTARISTVQSKFGGASLWLDGSAGTFIETAASDDFSFGNDDFTIDFWIRSSVAGPNNVNPFGLSDPSLSSRGASFFAQFTGGRLYFYLYYGSNSAYVISSTTFAANKWYHVAAVRKEGVLTLYVNGIAENRTPATIPVKPAQNKLAIGRAGEFNGQYFDGNIDEFRIIKGKAMYTADFIPPTTEYTYQATFTDTVKTLDKYYQLTTVLQPLRGGYGGNGGYGGGNGGGAARSTGGIGGSGRVNLGGFGGGGGGGCASATGGSGGNIDYAEIGNGSMSSILRSAGYGLTSYVNGTNGGGGSGTAYYSGTGGNYATAGNGGGCVGGGGGGGGGAALSGASQDVTGSGGGSGSYAGGLVLLVSSGNITINSGGTIKADGGAGGNGGNGNAAGNVGAGGGGGGGGSGGGVVGVYYTGAYTNNGAITVNGGAGGAGNSGSSGEAGGPGTSGSVGTIYTQKIS